jgi:ribosomal protein L37AE/L43A
MYKTPEYRIKKEKYCPKCNLGKIKILKDHKIEGLKNWKCEKCGFEFTGAPEKLIYLDLATNEEVGHYAKMLTKLSKEEIIKVFDKCGWCYGDEKMYSKIQKSVKFAENQIWNLLEDTPSDYDPAYHIETHKLLKKALAEVEGKK